LHVSGDEGASTLYYVTFELHEDRNHEEFRRSARSSSLLAEGDRGAFHSRLIWFQGFDCQLRQSR
jgi:hypothetical protein